MNLPGIVTALQAATGSEFSVAPMGRMGEPASGIIDYVIVGSALVAVVVTTVLMVRGLVRPGEQAPHHIKRVILDGAAPAAHTLTRANARRQRVNFEPPRP